MSCHGTPGNRACTSLANALTNTPSDEVSRRFHDLKREAADQTESPTADQVVDWLDRQALAVRAEQTLSAWRVERLLAQIAQSRDAALAGDLPDGPTWSAWMNLRAALDEAHAHAWFVSAAGIRLPLTEMEPAAIDEQLAGLWSEIDSQTHRRRILLRDIAHAQANMGRYGINEESLARRRQSLADADARIDGLLDKTAPLEAEYARRGRWARYFRVITSGSGHVHTSRSCHSCFPTTIYSWLPELSGKGQDDAVEDYGSEMCSHCLPAVTTHPAYATRGRIAEEVAAARATERAQKAAARAVKEITSPDGSPLRIGTGRYPETVKSAVTAERLLVDRLTAAQTTYTPAWVNRWIGDADEQSAARHREHQAQRASEAAREAEQLATALAHKRGMTVGELLETVAGKVNAKVRKAQRDFTA